MKLLILFFLFFSSLLANEITLEFLKDKPKSITKDFYIWRFLDQDITPQEAELAFEMVNRKSPKIISRYKRKTNNKEFLEKQNCYALGSGQFLSKKNECIILGLTPSKANGIPNGELLQIAKKIEKDYPKTASVAKVFASKYPIKEMLSAKPKVFLEIFTRIDEDFRHKHLNLNYSSEFLEKLSKEKKFEYFVKLLTVIDSDMLKARESLLNFNSKDANSDANFLLAINAIEFNKIKEALLFLDFSLKSAKNRFDRDKILFWKYLLTKDFKYLAKIIDESYDINIYTLYASEKLNEKIPNIVTYVVTNKKDKEDFNISNPFLWVNKFREFDNNKSIKEITKEFNYINTEPHLTYLLERENNYKINYYIFPFRDYFKDFNLERKAMLLAIARQESRFIPTAISTSYALGMMQIMPFLAEHISKTLKRDITLDDMLKPEISIEFANYHLDHDLRSLSHPLFIAYAYNGGIGFTKRMLKSGAFNTNSQYEPFFSMEKVPFDETRDYGKKVLANYIMYKKLLGEKVTLSKVLNDIENSTKTLYAKK